MIRPIFFAPRAIKDLKGFPREVQKGILDDLEALAIASNPLISGKVKKLKGREGLYRLRTENHRTLFKLTKEGIQVIRSFDRKDLNKILSQLWG